MNYRVENKEMIHTHDEDRLTQNEKKRIREFIAASKKEYMESPTYVEAPWAEGGGQLEEKRLHSDWWDELNGTRNEEEWPYDPSRETYYEVIERELVRILRARPDGRPDDELECAKTILPAILEDFAIHDRPRLGDLAKEYHDGLRRWFSSLPLREAKGELHGWFDYLNRKGIARYGADPGGRIDSVPIEFVLDRLEGCNDVFGVECAELGLSTDMTYAQAVAIAHQRLDGADRE